MSDERSGLPSASGAYIFYHCPGSLKAQEQAPEAFPSVEAAEGQDIHAALEDEDFTKLTEEGLAIAERILQMRDKAYDQWKKETGISTSSAHMEERLWISDRKSGMPIASARLDFFALQAPFAFGLDYKTGYLKVTKAAKNIQLRIQALALWHEYPELEDIAVGTAQYRFTGKLDMAVYRPADLQQAEKELLFRLWLAQQEDAPRVPGDWCRYCRAKGFCRENAAYSLLPVAMVPGSLTDPDNIKELVKQLSLEELAFIRMRAGMIEKVLSAVADRIRSTPNDQLATVGLRLDKGGNMRSIANADIDAIQDLVSYQGVTEEEFKSLLKLSVSDLEKVTIPHIDAKTKKEAKAKFDSLVGHFIKLTPKAYSIKLLKDKENEE